MSLLRSYLPWNNPSILPWLILYFAAINIIFLGGKRRAFGSFIAELHKNFSNVTLMELNWIGDSYSAFGYMSASASTALILYFKRRYGLCQFFGASCILLSCLTSSFIPNPHWLFLTHTIFNGIGSSFVLSIAGLIVIEYFDINHPYHILATTLICGGSLASILFISLFAYLIQQYNWRMAFIILGLIYFVVNASSAFFFRRNEQLSKTATNKLKFQFDGIRKSQIPLLILWFLERILTGVVTYGLFLNLTDYLYRINPDLIRSNMLTSIFAGGEGLSYLTTAVITALIKDFFENKMGYILIGTSMLAGVALIAIEFVNRIVTIQRLLCFITGYGIGFSNALFYPAGEELMKLPGHLAYPFSLTGNGVGMILSPLFTAKIAEILFYKWFFLVQGSLIFIKVICLGLMMILLFYYKKYDILQDNSGFDDGNNIEVELNFPGESSKLMPETMKNSS